MLTSDIFNSIESYLKNSTITLEEATQLTQYYNNLFSLKTDIGLLTSDNFSTLQLIIEQHIDFIYSKNSYLLLPIANNMHNKLSEDNNNKDLESIDLLLKKVVREVTSETDNRPTIESNYGQLTSVFYDNAKHKTALNDHFHSLIQSFFVFDQDESQENSQNQHPEHPALHSDQVESHSRSDAEASLSVQNSHQRYSLPSIIRKMLTREQIRYLSNLLEKGNPLEKVLANPSLEAKLENTLYLKLARYRLNIGSENSLLEILSIYEDCKSEDCKSLSLSTLETVSHSKPITQKELEESAKKANIQYSLLYKNICQSAKKLSSFSETDSQNDAEKIACTLPDNLDRTIIKTLISCFDTLESKEKSVLDKLEAYIKLQKINKDHLNGSISKHWILKENKAKFQGNCQNIINSIVEKFSSSSSSSSKEMTSAFKQLQNSLLQVPKNDSVNRQKYTFPPIFSKLKDYLTSRAEDLEILKKVFDEPNFEDLLKATRPESTKKDKLQYQETIQYILSIADIFKAFELEYPIKQYFYANKKYKIDRGSEKNLLDSLTIYFLVHYRPFEVDFTSNSHEESTDTNVKLPLQYLISLVKLANEVDLSNSDLQNRNIDPNLSKLIRYLLIVVHSLHSKQRELTQNFRINEIVNGSLSEIINDRDLNDFLSAVHALDDNKDQEILTKIQDLFTHDIIAKIKSINDENVLPASPSTSVPPNKNDDSTEISRKDRLKKAQNGNDIHQFNSDANITNIDNAQNALQWIALMESRIALMKSSVRCFNPSSEELTQFNTSFLAPLKLSNDFSQQHPIIFNALITQIFYYIYYKDILPMSLHGPLANKINALLTKEQKETLLNKSQQDFLIRAASDSIDAVNDPSLTELNTDLDKLWLEFKALCYSVGQYKLSDYVSHLADIYKQQLKMNSTDTRLKDLILVLSSRFFTTGNLLSRIENEIQAIRLSPKHQNIKILLESSGQNPLNTNVVSSTQLEKYCKLLESSKTDLIITDSPPNEGLLNSLEQLSDSLIALDDKSSEVSAQEETETLLTCLKLKDSIVAALQENNITQHEILKKLENRKTLLLKRLIKKCFTLLNKEDKQLDTLNSILVKFYIHEANLPSPSQSQTTISSTLVERLSDLLKHVKLLHQLQNHKDYSETLLSKETDSYKSLIVIKASTTLLATLRLKDNINDHSLLSGPNDGSLLSDPLEAWSIFYCRLIPQYFEEFHNSQGNSKRANLKQIKDLFEKLLKNYQKASFEQPPVHVFKVLMTYKIIYADVLLKEIYANSSALDPLNHLLEQNFSKNRTYLFNQDLDTIQTKLVEISEADGQNQEETSKLIESVQNLIEKTTRVKSDSLGTDVLIIDSIKNFSLDSKYSEILTLFNHAIPYFIQRLESKETDNDARYDANETVEESIKYLQEKAPYLLLPQDLINATKESLTQFSEKLSQISGGSNTSDLDSLFSHSLTTTRQYLPPLEKLSARTASTSDLQKEITPLINVIQTIPVYCSYKIKQNYQNAHCPLNRTIEILRDYDSELLLPEDRASDIDHETALSDNESTNGDDERCSDHEQSDNKSTKSSDASLADNHHAQDLENFTPPNTQSNNLACSRLSLFSPADNPDNPDNPNPDNNNFNKN